MSTTTSTPATRPGTEPPGAPPPTWTGMRRGGGTRLGAAVRYLVLGVAALAVLVPLAWIVLGSFKSQAELFRTPPPLVPERLRLDNYTDALSQFAFLRYLRNSVVVTVGATVLTLVINTMAAFALAKYNFRGRNLLFMLTLATLMVPLQLILVPVFLVAASLGLTDSLWGLIIAPAATPTGVFLLRQYMLTIPDELLDAARIDGASEWRIFVRIMLPLCRPALAVVAIFSVLWRWNDFLWPLIIVQSDELLTLQVALARFQSELTVSWNYVLAMTVVSMLPVVIAFLFMQRQIVAGMANTGLKG